MSESAHPFQKLVEPAVPHVFPNQEAKKKAVDEALYALNFAQMSLANAADSDAGSVESINHQLESATFMLARAQRASVGPTPVPLTPEKKTFEPVIFLDPDVKAKRLTAAHKSLEETKAYWAAQPAEKRDPQKEEEQIRNAEESIDEIESWIIEEPFQYKTLAEKMKAALEIRNKVERLREELYRAELDRKPNVSELREMLFNAYRIQSRTARGSVEESEE